MPLIDAVIRNSHPRDRAYKLFDGDGLHLLIQPSGSKLWRMRYILSGKERMLSFGPYPAVTLAAARKKRDEARLLLRYGTDPRRQIVREGQTFEDVARAWHANREDSLDPAHAVRVLSRLERDAFPTLGAKVLAEIEPPDVVETVRLVEARGSLDVSRRLKQDISQVFRFAIAHGWAKIDPARDIGAALRPRPRTQHMSRIPLSEIGTFLDVSELVG